ncbi:MAG TPA: glycerophosphodiester phosphodiesterase [Nitrososphaerales archaeon]|nr:glycerophosphodiester phosphodiesterase [Nitrososphaerales archaeon]
MGLFAEVKEPGTEGRIASMLERGGLERDCVTVSFHHRSILSVKESHPKIRCGVIYSGGPIRPWLVALDAKAEMLVPNYNNVDGKMVEEAHGRKLLVQTWTVNNADDAESMVEAGVDGIASDFDVVLAAIAERRPVTAG